MKDSCYHIVTHKDLDGLVSLLVFMWAKPDSHITYRTVTNITVESQIREYIENTVNHHKVYIVDLALRESFLEFDLPFITIIDHHTRSKEFIHRFKQAKIIVRPEFGSNSKMLYKFFSDNGIIFSDDQKKLVALCDDFDSGKNLITASKNLNILFWNEYRNDVNGFLKYYENGFKPFHSGQLKIINDVKRDAKIAASHMPLFRGVIRVDGKEYPVISSFGETINLLSIDILMEEHKTNIMFFINTKNQKVSMKQKYSENPVDLSNIARKYCEGNGGIFSAGGKLTDLFMELTKSFKAL